MTLTCLDCGSDFDHVKGGTRPRRCPPCRPAYQRRYMREYLPEYYQRNAEKIRGRSSRWAKENPDRHRAGGWRRELARFGLTPEQYEEMLKAQKGGCAICLSPPDGKRLAVDHDHATGRVRGLLCTACNTSIGKFKDSPVLLRRAADYLEGG